VSVALGQVDDDDRARQGLVDELNKKPKPKSKSPQRPRRTGRTGGRVAHWQ